MKKEQFKRGDKVFAKVKGYPPWPAIILDEAGKKYLVKFYGTGEIGQIKAEDLFYYMKNKAKLLKPSKRKDFNDSVQEIESAISEAGTDGDPSYGNENKDSSLNDTASLIDSELSNPKKRKRSISAVKKVEASPLNKSKKGKVSNKTNETDSSIITQDSQESKDEETPELNKPEENKTQSEESEKQFDKSEKQSDESKKQSDESKKQADESKKQSDESKTQLDESKKQSDEKQEELTKNKDCIEVESREDSLENHVLIEEVATTEEPSCEDFVFEKELEGYIVYGEHVEKHKEIYSEMPENIRFCTKLQCLPFYKNEKCIGIKLYEEWPIEKFKNEYDRAIYDKKIFEQALKLKELFKLEDLEKSPEKYFLNLDLNEKDLNRQWEGKLISYKEEAMEYFKQEKKLAVLESKIKNCLNLEKADAKEAIGLMEKMLELNILPIMLKKHVHVVDMVRRLKKYVGNMECWNLTEDDAITFGLHAEQVRGMATKLQIKLMNVIGRPDKNQSFWDHFNNIASKFREETKDFSEMEFFMLTNWPFSRQSFLHHYLMRDISSSITSQLENMEEI